MSERFQNPHTLILLGDAYMNILEVLIIIFYLNFVNFCFNFIIILKPEKAVEVYETALVKNPKDAVLAKKIGQALIKSHQYNKAISYYVAALKSGHQNLLRFDLAELYTKLNQLDNAEKIISDALSDKSKKNII